MPSYGTSSIADAMKNTPNQDTLRSCARNRTAFRMPRDPVEAAEWGKLILEMVRDGEIVRLAADRIVDFQLVSGQVTDEDIWLAPADGHAVDPAEWLDPAVRWAGLPDPDRDSAMNDRGTAPIGAQRRGAKPLATTKRAGQKQPAAPTATQRRGAKPLTTTHAGRKQPAVGKPGSKPRPRPRGRAGSGRTSGS